MPYGLVSLLLVLAATGWFVFATDASRGSKLFVSAVCLASFAPGFLAPQWGLAGLLLQVLLVIGIVLYSKVHR